MKEPWIWDGQRQKQSRRKRRRERTRDEELKLWWPEKRERKSKRKMRKKEEDWEWYRCEMKNENHLWKWKFWKFPASSDKPLSSRLRFFWRPDNHRHDDGGGGRRKVGLNWTIQPLTNSLGLYYMRHPIIQIECNWNTQTKSEREECKRRVGFRVNIGFVAHGPTHLSLFPSFYLIITVTSHFTLIPSTTLPLSLIFIYLFYISHTHILVHSYFSY